MSDRHDVLKSTRLLDSPSEAAFDRLTRLAGTLIGAQVALVSLVDRSRQFFKSSWGLGEPWASRRETPLSHSFCQHVVADTAPLIVDDARRSPRLRDNLAIPELGVIAYAGMPLVVDGQAIGALCVIDDKPRAWSDADVRLLRDLADSVVSEIELRIALRAAEDQRAVTAALVDSMGDIVLAIDAERRFLIVNEAARKVFLRAEVGKPLPADWTAAHRSHRPDGTALPSEEGAMVRALSGAVTDGLTFTLNGPGMVEPAWLEATARPVRDSDGQVVAAVAVYRDVTERTRQADRYHAVASNVPRGAVALFDGEQRCLAIDGVLLRDSGIDPQKLIGRSMRLLAGRAGGAGFDAVEEVFRQTLEGASLTRDFDTGQRTLALHTAPVRDELGRVTAGLVLALDVTLERQIEAEMRRSEQIHRAMVKNLPSGAILLLDRELRYVFADGPIIGDILRNAKLPNLVGHSALEVTSAAIRESVLDLYRSTLRGERGRLEVARDGRTFEMRTVPIYERDEISHALVLLYDVTERRREAEQLREMRDRLVGERALFEATLAHIEDGVALLDGRQRVLIANAALATMFGLSQLELRELSPKEFIAHVFGLLDDSDGSRDRFLDQRPGSCEELTFVRPRRRVLRRSWMPVQLPERDGFLVTWHDITSDKAMLAERDHQLLVDALTGIPNRRAADTAIKIEHARMRRLSTPMSVAVFDIDHFKQVNDRYGHATGDRVLCQVAVAIAAEARLTDTVARWGGEEFIAILPGPLAGAQTFCERTRVAIENLCCPGVGRITASVGVAEVLPDEDPATTIARADQLLYEAKRAGRNRVMK